MGAGYLKRPLNSTVSAEAEAEAAAGAGGQKFHPVPLVLDTTHPDVGTSETVGFFVNDGTC